MRVEVNTVVSLSCRVTDAQGEVIDDGTEVMQYLHGGFEAIFPKLEEALHHKSVGDNVQIQLEPDDAFGEYDAELLRVEPRDAFPETLEIGMQFEGVPGDDESAFDGVESDDEEVRIYMVTDIADDKVVVDGNHPLAGMALRFFAKVVEIRAATADEIENGAVADIESRFTITPRTLH